MIIYDEDDNVIEDPDLSIGRLYEDSRIKAKAEPIDNETKYAWDPDDIEVFMRYHVYTEDELLVLEAREVESAKVEALDAFLDAAPSIQAEQDAAICELYEQNLAMQAESDRAITDLYEMLLEVNNG